MVFARSKITLTPLRENAVLSVISHAHICSKARIRIESMYGLLLHVLSKLTYHDELKAVESLVK
jgi:hypothetical protein